MPNVEAYISLNFFSFFIFFSSKERAGFKKQDRQERRCQNSKPLNPEFSTLSYCLISSCLAASIFLCGVLNQPNSKIIGIPICSEVLLLSLMYSSCKILWVINPTLYLAKVQRSICWQLSKRFCLVITVVNTEVRDLDFKSH